MLRDVQLDVGAMAVTLLLFQVFPGVEAVEDTAVVGLMVESHLVEVIEWKLAKAKA